MEKELPEGWTVEVRPRKRGKYKSSKYKVYTDPITKHKFYSKPEVFCYLQSNRNSRTRPMKSGHNKANKSASKPVCAVNNVTQELPPGWTVDMRVRGRKKGGCKPKTDKYYIEPGTDRVFCSMKQVFHYLETGEVSDRMSKKKLNNVKLRDVPPLPSEEHKKPVPAIRGTKNTLKRQPHRDWDSKEQSKGEKKRAPEIKAGRKIIQCQEVKDRDSKSQSKGKGDGDPDCKENTKITNEKNIKSRAGTREKGSVKRAGSFPEEKGHIKRRKEWDCPGNTNVSPPAQAKVPASPAVNGKSSTIAESSTAVDEDRIAQRANGGQNDENAAADAEHKPVEVDELIGRKLNNQNHEVSVMKLSKGNVDNKGSNSSVVHKREGQIRDVLNKLQGPVLLPAGYIPLPPAGHHTCTSSSETNENCVAGKLNFPFNYVLTDPCFASGRTTPKETVTAGGDAVTNEGFARFKDNLLSTSVWDDPCFHFAVKTLASELKVPGDSGDQ